MPPPHRRSHRSRPHVTTGGAHAPRIPRRRAHRRLAAALATAIALPVVVGPSPSASAADALPSMRELEARRRSLVADIAAATDEVARLESTAETLLGAVMLQSAAVETTRKSVADRVVQAWVAAADVNPVLAGRGRAWSDALTAGDRRALADLEVATDRLVDRRREALDAADAAERARDQLLHLREELERAIVERRKADADAAAARSAATAGARGGRTVRTTADQQALMARLPFGPISGIPDGLVATGTVVSGKASWYGPGFDGRPTASGAVFDQQGWTVAHRTLPLGTILLVTRGDASVLVLVNDRGPFVGGRVLDLSKGVAEVLGTIRAGVADVTAQVLVEG